MSVVVECWGEDAMMLMWRVLWCQHAVLKFVFKRAQTCAMFCGGG